MVYTFLSHWKLHITEASTVQCTQGCSVNQKVWGQTYVIIAYQICKDHYYTGVTRLYV